MLEVVLGVLALAGVVSSAWLYSRQKKTPGRKVEERTPPPREAVSVSEARAKAREIVVEAKDEAQRIRQESFELEKKITGREAVLSRQEEELNSKQRRLKNFQRKLYQKEQESEELRQEQIAKLEKVASLTSEEARSQIISEIEKSLRDEIARRIKQAEEVVKEKGDERGKDILVSAIQQAGTDYVAEYTTSRLKLPDEEMKGRIIGKEGRNIKALEQATGVDFDLDETPSEVRVSSFDGFRREVARIALERLIADGRIQPARIEETVVKVKREMESRLKGEGDKLADDAGVTGLPESIVKLLGRYKFRTSYGQNLAKHSLEVMNLAKFIAAEIGADVALVKKAALLHDIGKVMTAEMDGPHTRIGREIMEKAGFDEKLINAAEAHHEEEEFKSVEAVVIYIADAVSGARPGARFENYEAYVKRMREFEELAASFEGVDKAYVLSAGREVRVMLSSSETNDSTVTKLSHDIAEKIQSSLTYPGQVKVTVVREVREESIAK